MPSKSPAQARLMAAAAHTKGGYGGVPQSVGKEFNSADKGTGILRMKSGADKGRATQQHARGTMDSGKKARIHAQSNRALGYTFHTIKGN